MQIVEMLLELQQNYDKVKECNRSVKEYSNMNLLKSLKAKFENFKMQYSNKINILKGIKKENVLISEKINSIKEEIKNNEYKLYNESGSDVKCIEILEHKIEEHENKIKDLEDTSIDILEKEEILENEIESLRVELSHIKEDFYKTKENNHTNLSEIKKQRIKLQNRISKLKESIPKEYLDIFMSILDRKGSAVAELEGGVCCGCKMKISTMTKDDVSKGKELIYCDNCGRILHYKSDL